MVELDVRCEMCVTMASGLDCLPRNIENLRCLTDGSILARLPVFLVLGPVRYV